MVRLAAIPRRLSARGTALAPVRWRDLGFVGAAPGLLPAGRRLPPRSFGTWLAVRCTLRPAWVVWAGPERIGVAGLYGLRPGTEAYLSLWLDPTHRGRGHGTRAFRLLCEALGTRAAVRRVLAEVATDNAACLGALRRAGFEPVGRAGGRRVLVRELEPGHGTRR